MLKTDEMKWDRSPLITFNLNDSVYFVHSFVAKPETSSDTVAGFSFGGSIFLRLCRKRMFLGASFTLKKVEGRN